MTIAGRATQDDVARRAGVSTAVVSYVVNNGPRPVAPSTRDRVRQAMSELDYRPNASARALKLAKTGTLGLLVPDIGNPFFSQFAKYVQDVAHTRNYALLVGATALDPEREAEQLSSIVERGVDGLIVFGIRDPSLLDTVISSGIPIVSMDWQLKNGGVPTIVADDYGAAVAAVSHLVGHGHTDIGYIGGPDDLEISHIRQKAWVDIVAPLVSATRLQQLQSFAPFSRQGGDTAATALLAGQPNRPTALFVSSDVQAVGVLHACYQLSLTVPDDLAIVSFDGTEDSEFSCPPMTAVQLPLELMASRAIETLLGRSGSVAIHSTVPHQLLVRRSCGCDSPK
jgi:LacI family transcriptional regulator